MARLLRVSLSTYQTWERGGPPLNRRIEELVQAAAKSGYTDLAKALLQGIQAAAGVRFELNDGRIQPQHDGAAPAPELGSDQPARSALETQRCL